MRQLAPRARTAVALRYVADLAEAMGISVGAAASTLSRGRAVRRRRQFGAGAVTIAAASVVAIMGVTGVLHRTGQRDRSSQAASTTPADQKLSAASAALLAPCAPIDVPKKATPAQFPEVLYLVDPATVHAVSARLYIFGRDCDDASVTGADFSLTGTPVRSFGLTYTAIPTDPHAFPDDGLPHTRLRGHDATIAGGAAAWVEDGIVWRWNSSGLSGAQIVQAIEQLRPDPAHPGCSSRRPRSWTSWPSRTSHPPPRPGSSTTGRAHIGGASRWRPACRPAGLQLPSLASDGRLLMIAGRQVFVSPQDGTGDGKGNVGQAVFMDGQGRSFLIEGELTDRQLREIIPHITKVAPDSPELERIPLVGPPGRSR